MPSAIDAVEAALREDLHSGRLSGRLPGMRALASRFGISTFVIFQAIARLEAERLVERRPRSGVQALTTAPLRVLIGEDQPWQIRHWRAVVAKAPMALDLRFYPREQVVAQLNDDVPTVVLSIVPGLLSGLPRVDLSALVPDDLLPLAQLDATTLAYLLQPVALVHRSAELPPAAADWTALIRWMSRTFGSGSLVPPPLAVLADSLDGDAAAVAAALAGNAAPLAQSLTAMVSVLAELCHSGVLGPPLHEPRALSDALAEHRLGGAMRSSFLWPTLGVGPGGIHGVSPLPGTCVPAIIGASLVAKKPARTALDFLRFLMSPVVQRQLMVTGSGLSPRRSVLRDAVQRPEGLPRGLPSVAAQMLSQVKAPSPVSADLRDLLAAFAERIALPLLAGELNPRSARTRIPALLSQLTTTAGDRQRTALRSLLLSEA